MWLEYFKLSFARFWPTDILNWQKHTKPVHQEARYIGYYSNPIMPTTILCYENIQYFQLLHRLLSKAFKPQQNK